MAFFLKAKGLYTFKNELDKPEGSLEVADNIVIDEDGIIEPRRGNAIYGNSFGAGEDRLKQIMVYKERLIRYYGDILQLDSGSGVFSNFSGNYQDVVDNLRLKYKEVNGNLYFTTRESIKKISAKNSASLSTSTPITNAGGVKAVDLEAVITPIASGFMPPQSKVAYRVVWGIKDANNNLILGTPSARFELTNNSSNVEINENFSISVTGALTGAEYILFESNDNQYFVWFNTGADTEPSNQDTVGRTAIEAKIKNVTTSEDASIIATAISNAANFEFDVTVDTNVITVISKTSGDIPDASSSATNITVTVEEQGKSETGDFADSELTFTIPTDVNSLDYFYQIYRSSVVEVTEGLTIDDIQPDDEMNLIIESGVTLDQLELGEIIVTDNVPETFRASGAFLYTNPITGDGILNANEKPPIAQDIEFFRNSLFYANTKTAHRLQFNLLSVSAFVSGTSDLVIGNSDVRRTYTFIGTPEEFDITTDTFANTLEGSWLEINSARNERKYNFYFDKGSATEPSVSGRTNVRVNIKGLTTASEISLALTNSLNSTGDFAAIDGGGSINVVTAKNGYTDDAAFGATAPGGAWVIAKVADGTGEDVANQEVILSGQISAAQSIDETARSLVKVINRDSLSPVNAFYLSNADDLPGIILLENKDQEDKPFYLATSDSNINTQFNPELSLTQTTTLVKPDNGINTNARVYSAGHTINIDDLVYVEDPDSNPVIRGAYNVTDTGSDIDGDYFVIDFPIATGSNGLNAVYWLADTPSDNEEAANRVYFSKLQQPEAVPLLNYVDIGSKNKEILRIVALRDNLFVLKEDGIYIITGSSAPNFAVRLLDSSVTVTAPDTAVVLNNQIYCLADDGVVTITETGVSVISRPIEDKILDVTNSKFDFKYKAFGVAYHSDRSYLMWMPTETTDVNSTQCYRYNTFTRTWTRFIISATCGRLLESEDKLYLGDGDSNNILQERKNRDRTDHADKDLANAIPSSSTSTNVIGTSVLLSNTGEVDLGDVLLQEQSVTIPRLRYLLRTLDIDSGLDDTDYEASILPDVGANMKNTLDALNAKLEADDASGTITARVFSTDIDAMRTEFNALIAELNENACDTLFKNYETIDENTIFETIVESIAVLDSRVNVRWSIPLLEGDVRIYKSIPTEVQYAPQHFGDPATLKQIREGSFIFDQRQFNIITISYASDQSPDFDEVEDFGESNGQWGTPIWGDFNWGGRSDDIPIRTYIPLEKQRCRYLSPKFQHANARETFRLLGISLEPRLLSTRAYR